MRRRRLAACLMLLALGVVADRAVARAHGVPAAPVTVVVAPGDTLWSLGVRYAPPHTDVRRWVWRVEQLNGLPDGRLTAGQALRLPR